MDDQSFDELMDEAFDLDAENPWLSSMVDPDPESGVAPVKQADETVKEEHARRTWRRV